jgi:hypothetical protein
VAGAFECGNKRSGFTKCGEFLDKLRTFQLLRKDCAPRYCSVKDLVKRTLLVTQTTQCDG